MMKIVRIFCKKIKLKLFYYKKDEEVNDYFIQRNIIFLNRRISQFKINFLFSIARLAL